MQHHLPDKVSLFVVGVWRSRSAQSWLSEAAGCRLKGCRADCLQTELLNLEACGRTHDALWFLCLRSWKQSASGSGSTPTSLSSLTGKTERFRSYCSFCIWFVEVHCADTSKRGLLEERDALWAHLSDRFVVTQTLKTADSSISPDCDLHLLHKRLYKQD